MRGRSYGEAAEQQAIAAWLARWRCASARHLVAIYRPKRHRRGADRLSVRQGQRVLNLIARDGHAELVSLRSNVTRKVFRATSAMVTSADWVTVDLAAALASQGGTICRGLEAAVAVRRHLLDQSPAEVANVLRGDPRTPRGEGYSVVVAVLKSEPVLLWVDDGRDIDRQASELPVWTNGQARLRVIVRSPDTSWRGDGDGPILGPRLKEMVTALKRAPGARPVGFWDGGWWHGAPDRMSGTHG